MSIETLILAEARKKKVIRVKHLVRSLEVILRAQGVSYSRSTLEKKSQKIIQEMVLRGVLEYYRKGVYIYKGDYEC